MHIVFRLCCAWNRRTIIYISVYCNTEFWSLSSDRLSGYIKAQAFSVSDSFFFLTGTHWFWTGTHHFSQDESQDSPKQFVKKHNFTRVYKVEAMSKWPRVSKGWARFNFYLYARPSIHCLFFFFGRKRVPCVRTQKFTTLEIHPNLNELCHEIQPN